MRLNTAEGYGEALRALESIPFVYEAREKAEYCRQRLDELEAERERRQEFEQLSDKIDTVVGVILLVFMVIFCVAAVAGAGYLIFQFARGSLSPKTVTTIIIIAVVAAALVVVNKMRR